jgi:hypothetical protein
MPDKGWRSKGDKGIRSSPRQTGKTCGRPFSAPRKARDTTEKTAKITAKETNDSEVRVLTESELEILASMGAAIPGFEDSDEAQADYVLPGDPNQDKTEQDRQAQEIGEETAPVQAESDTTESTPDILQSPDKVQDRVPGSLANAPSVGENTVGAKTVAPKKYKGWVFIPETEEKEGSSDSADNEPIASQLKPQTVKSKRLQELQDFREGPVGKRAIGKTIAKIFDSVEFRGKVDSFRQVRQRYYYHVTYDDGDEEEMRQVELRDAYLLANTEKIETEYDQLQRALQSDKDVGGEQSSQDETDSGSEGSLYDRHDYENELKQGKRKRKRKTTFKPVTKRSKPYKRAEKKRSNDLSGVILPTSGDKSVAGEAFAKLDSAQQGIVKSKINKKTKQVIPSFCEFRSWSKYNIYCRWRSNRFAKSSSTLAIMMR